MHPLHTTPRPQTDRADLQFMYHRIQKKETLAGVTAAATLRRRYPILKLRVDIAVACSQATQTYDLHLRM